MISCCSHNNNNNLSSLAQCMCYFTISDFSEQISDIIELHWMTNMPKKALGVGLWDFAKSQLINRSFLKKINDMSGEVQRELWWNDSIAACYISCTGKGWKDNQNSFPSFIATEQQRLPEMCFHCLWSSRHSADEMLVMVRPQKEKRSGFLLIMPVGYSSLLASTYGSLNSLFYLWKGINIAQHFTKKCCRWLLDVTHSSCWFAALASTESQTCKSGSRFTVNCSTLRVSVPFKTILNTSPKLQLCGWTRVRGVVHTWATDVENESSSTRERFWYLLFRWQPQRSRTAVELNKMSEVSCCSLQNEAC